MNINRYTPPELEILDFRPDDVITTSYEGWNPQSDSSKSGEYEGWNPHNSGAGTDSVNRYWSN